MNSVTAVALQILAIWFDSADRTPDSAFGRKYAIRWRTVGLINHDRVLNGRKDLIHTWSFSGAPK